MDDNWNDVSALTEEEIVSLSKRQKVGVPKGPPPLPPPLPPPGGVASSSSLPETKEVVVEKEEASEAIASPIEVAKLLTFDELAPLAQFGCGIQPESLDVAKDSFVKL